MKLTKNKIKHLLNVKNQTQKRFKEYIKNIYKRKNKTVGRKRAVNLRYNTLKRPQRGGTLSATLVQTLILDLADFIQLKDTLTYKKIGQLRSAGEKVKTDINKFMHLPTVQELTGKRVTLNKLLETWLTTVRKIKMIKKKKNTTQTVYEKNIVTLITKKNGCFIRSIKGRLYSDNWAGTGLCKGGRCPTRI